MPQFEPKDPIGQYIPLLLNLQMQQQRDRQQQESDRIEQGRKYLMDAAKLGLNIPKLSNLVPWVPPGDVSAIDELSKGVKKQVAEEQKRAKTEADTPELAEGLGAVMHSVGKGGDPRSQTSALSAIEQQHGPEAAKRISVLAQGQQAELEERDRFQRMKDRDDVESSKDRILLRILSGKKVTPAERAFMSELQNMDPLERFRRGIVDQVIGGGKNAP